MGSTGRQPWGLVDMVRGDTIVDPRQKDEAMRAHSMAQRVGLYFPVSARLVRLRAAHICEVNLDDGFVNPNDCIDVPEDSTIEDAHFWCGVGSTTNPSWSE
jgi:hypothetical protein